MVRPVELQDSLAKTQAVERISQLQKANLENEQRHHMQSGARKANEAQRRTVPTAHPDEVILHREPQDKDKKNKKKRKPGEPDDNTPPADEGEETGSHDSDPPPPVLDIQV